MGTEEIPQSRSEHSPQPNPALTDLEIFVGKWEMEVSNASFLPDPSDTIQGHVSIEWLEDGAFLVLHQGEKSDPPFANWLISRDESVETYQIFYFDNRGVSRIYQMSFNDGIWRHVPGFFQRFKGKFTKDRRKITAQWEISSDGKIWEHDFDLTYRKIK